MFMLTTTSLLHWKRRNIVFGLENTLNAWAGYLFWRHSGYHPPDCFRLVSSNKVLTVFIHEQDQKVIFHTVHAPHHHLSYCGGVYKISYKIRAAASELKLELFLNLQQKYFQLFQDSTPKFFTNSSNIIGNNVHVNYYFTASLEKKKHCLCLGKYFEFFVNSSEFICRNIQKLSVWICILCSHWLFLEKFDPCTKVLIKHDICPSTLSWSWPSPPPATPILDWEKAGADCCDEYHGEGESVLSKILRLMAAVAVLIYPRVGGRGAGPPPRPPPVGWPVWVGKNVEGIRSSCWFEM